MKIGIFGGSFNPPHIMHRDIALELLEKKILDKVIYVPTGNKYNKRDLVSDKDRYNMLSIMIKNYNNLEVSDYEFNNNLTYTYQTLDYFRGTFPDDEIYFILGADNLEYFDTWRESEYILNNYKILVTNRGDINLNNLLNKYYRFKNNIIVTNIESKDISSTLIRDKLKISSENLEELQNVEVINYIKEKGLYRE